MFTRSRRGQLLAVLGVFCLASTARAGLTPVSPTPHPTEVNLQGGSGILDNLYGLSNLTRIDDFGTSITDQLWVNEGTASAVAKASYADFVQHFGYVNGASGGSLHELFSVDASLPSGTYSFTAAQSGNIFRWGNNPDDKTNADEPPLWTSLMSDNVSGQDHLVTYLISGNSGSQYTGNAVGSYVIAWEDFNCLGDHDYNDLVVEVDGAHPVPEPATLLFLAGGAGWLVRRRKR